MRVVFRGSEADRHQVEAYSGVESLGGITRVAVLVSHFVATREVRYRRPFSDDVTFFLERSEPGSLSFVFSLAIRNGARAQALMNDANRLMRRVVRRATGQVQAKSIDIEGIEIGAGDVDALAEAIEPGLRKGHTWIDLSGKTISISDIGTPVQLNLATKEYLETEIESPTLDVQDVSVGALNGNSRMGRVYFHDLGRTIPFKVPRDASARTIPTLSRFLTQYVEKTGATVNIQFRRVYYPDDRLKRIVIYDCFPIKGLN